MLAALPGWWERETQSQSKGKRGRVCLAVHGTQTGHIVSPSATCRHLHLGRSIPCHKKLRVPLEDKMHRFAADVNREGRCIWYSLLSFWFLKQN